MTFQSAYRELARFLPFLDRRYIRDTAAVRAMIDAQMTPALAAATERTAMRVGRLTLPTLLLGATNTQTLTWSQPMPSAAYQVYVGREQILGSGTVEVTGQTINGVTVKTTASALITVGAQLLVIAWND